MRITSRAHKLLADAVPELRYNAELDVVLQVELDGKLLEQVSEKGKVSAMLVCKSIGICHITALWCGVNSYTANPGKQPDVAVL